MTDTPQNPDPQLQIRKPCPKTWAELTGGGAKRFCSECSLHVHDAVQLTKSEAHAMLAGASARVCMRFEYDASGAPIFRDTRPAELLRLRARRPLAARVARWGLSAAAGLLAACHGNVPPPAPVDPPTPPSDVPMHPEMGMVAPSELGDVALPPRPLERLGEAVAVPAPTAPPESPTKPVDH